MRRIGLFGGTFNPPHIGHLWIAAAARDALELDRVIFMPANIPPHKALPEGTPSAQERLDMVRLAVRGMDGAEVSDFEIRRPGPSYTAQTVEYLKRKDPEAALWLIVGSDMLLTMQSWYRPEILFRSCRIAAAGRESGDGERIRRQAEYLSRAFGAQVDIIPAKAIPISSTQLRTLLPSGQAGRFLPPDVYAYIKEKRLYQSHESGA